MVQLILLTKDQVLNLNSCGISASYVELPFPFYLHSFGTRCLSHLHHGRSPFCQLTQIWSFLSCIIKFCLKAVGLCQHIRPSTEPIRSVLTDFPSKTMNYAQARRLVAIMQHAIRIRRHILHILLQFWHPKVPQKGKARLRCQGGVIPCVFTILPSAVPRQRLWVSPPPQPPQPPRAPRKRGQAWRPSRRLLQIQFGRHARLFSSMDQRGRR